MESSTRPERDLSPHITILLVEDVPGDARLLRETLADDPNTNIELEWITTLSSALERLAKGGIDLVLLDLGLPDSSGLDTLSQVKESAPTIPVVVVTGYHDHAVGLKAVQAGAQDYLPKNDMDGNILGRTVRYAIERKILEEELRQAQKMEIVGRLAGGVAHDFNNLLTAILGHARLGSMALPAGHPVGVALQEIETAAQRASSLTAQLLAFSRRDTLHLEIVGLNESIDSVRNLLGRLIGEDIELVFQRARGPVWVKVDAVRLEQVLMNLAINARDAMPSGGKLIIETSAAGIDDDSFRPHPDLVTGPYAMLTVSDDGIGMTQEVISHIFEPFYTTKEVGKGTGLGLSTCYGIVQQFGGHVSVTSSPGHGATFDIYLPLSEPEVEAATNQEGLEDNALPSGTETVLLAEDEAVVRLLISDVLRSHGYEVLEAADGIAADRLSQEHSQGDIDLLITDVVMPRMSGPELSERVRTAHPGIKVLYTSGYTGEHLIQSGFFESELDFLPKPFDLDDLVRKVRLTLRHERPVRAAGWSVGITHSTLPALCLPGPLA
jgi:signal transduction histidine kinase